MTRFPEGACFHGVVALRVNHGVSTAKPVPSILVDGCAIYSNSKRYTLIKIIYARGWCVFILNVLLMVRINLKLIGTALAK
jgi:hypothetical protein